MFTFFLPIWAVFCYFTMIRIKTLKTDYINIVVYLFFFLVLSVTLVVEITARVLESFKLSGHHPELVSRTRVKHIIIIILVKKVPFLKGQNLNVHKGEFAFA